MIQPWCTLIVFYLQLKTPGITGVLSCDAALRSLWRLASYLSAPSTLLVFAVKGGRWVK